jgi:hypothetical protein
MASPRFPCMSRSCVPCAKATPRLCHSSSSIRTGQATTVPEPNETGSGGLLPSSRLQNRFVKCVGLPLSRWRIELNSRDLKTTMGLEVLKCKTVNGILKELYVFALIYNLVMAIRFRVARQMGLCPARLSFVDTLRHVCVHGWIIPETLVINRERPGRWQPRVVKRRAKPHPLMTKPRNQYLTTEP